MTATAAVIVLVAVLVLIMRAITGIRVNRQNDETIITFLPEDEDTSDAVEHDTAHYEEEGHISNRAEVNDMGGLDT